jgi:hypothetical protein
VKFANEKGADGIHGPLGFSEFDASGILIEGFDEIPTAYGKYNYPYYSQMIEQLGFEKEVDWVEFRVTVPDKIPVRYSQIERSIAGKYKLQSVKLQSKKEVLKYADEIFQLLNKEYESIHGFSELTPNQVDALKKQFIPLLRLKFVSVVLNAENKVVGFGICLPSLSRALQQSKGNLFPFGFLHIQKALRGNGTIDSLLIAIHSDYRNKGVNALIFNDIGNAIVSEGIRYIETTRELEHNLFIQNLWNKFENRQHKRSRCYFKKI